MREIKFRMFDTEEKVFMNGSRVIESSISDLNNQGRWIYQQWTSLLDKNGKEIYEGDILEAPHTYQLTVFIEAGHVSIKWYDNGFPQKELLFQSEISRDDLEIIGNIYENPEILE